MTLTIGGRPRQTISRVNYPRIFPEWTPQCLALSPRKELYKAQFLFKETRLSPCDGFSRGLHTKAREDKGISIEMMEKSDEFFPARLDELRKCAAAVNERFLSRDVIKAPVKLCFPSSGTW